MLEIHHCGREPSQYLDQCTVTVLPAQSQLSNSPSVRQYLMFSPTVGMAPNVERSVPGSCCCLLHIPARDKTYLNDRYAEKISRAVAEIEVADQKEPTHRLTNQPTNQPNKQASKQACKQTKSCRSNLPSHPDTVDCHTGIEVSDQSYYQPQLLYAVTRV